MTYGERAMMRGRCARWALAAWLAAAPLAAGEGPNLLKDADFTDPAAAPSWPWQTMAAEVFTVDWRPGGGVTLESLGADYSGYLTQMVDVKPDTWYRLAVRTSHAKGRALLWVIGFDRDGAPLLYDQRKYLVSFVGNPLVPRFVRKELMNGTDQDEWREETLDFFTGNLPAGSKPIGRVRVNLGIYFSTARISFQQVSLREIPAPEAKP